MQGGVKSAINGAAAATVKCKVNNMMDKLKFEDGTMLPALVFLATLKVWHYSYSYPYS